MAGELLRLVLIVVGPLVLAEWAAAIFGESVR
jgi:hypothetical protein